MGVLGFFQALSSEVLRSDETRWEELRGRKVGIDAPILLTRAFKADPSPLAFLHYVTVRILLARNHYDLDLHFVFDAEEATAAKAKYAHPARRAQQVKAQENEERYRSEFEAAIVRQASEEERARCETKWWSAVKQGAHPRKAERDLLQRLLEALGFTWSVASGEAEITLARMQMGGLIDEIATEDSDALVSGASSIIRDFWSPGPLYRVHSAAICKEWQLTDSHDLQLMACLAGCDFAPKLTGIGVKKALAAVRKHSAGDVRARLEACLRTLKQSLETLDDLVEAQMIFATAATTTATRDAPALSPSAWEDFICYVENLGEPGRLRNLGVSSVRPSTCSFMETLRKRERDENGLHDDEPMPKHQWSDETDQHERSPKLCRASRAQGSRSLPELCAPECLDPRDDRGSPRLSGVEY